MITPSTRRAILRWFHLVLSIPVLGYIYGVPAEVAEYASGVRYLFVPVMMLSGVWMYAGVVFALIAVALWLGAYCLVGVGTAILCQVALFVARKVWLMFQARRATEG